MKAPIRCEFEDDESYPSPVIYDADGVAMCLETEVPAAYNALAARVKELEEENKFTGEALRCCHAILNLLDNDPRAAQAALKTFDIKI